MITVSEATDVHGEYLKVCVSSKGLYETNDGSDIESVMDWVVAGNRHVEVFNENCLL